MSCFYCQRNFTPTGATRKTRDHIIPLSRGGVNKAINRVAACFDCNILKGSRTLVGFINFISKKVKRQQKLRSYTQQQMKNIIEGAKWLFDNIFKVLGLQLFCDKYFFESYNDEPKFIIS